MRLYEQVSKHALCALVVCACLVAVGVALSMVGASRAELDLAAALFVAVLLTALVNGALAVLLVGVPIYVLLLETRRASWVSALAIGLGPAFVAFGMFDSFVTTIVGACGIGTAAYTHYMILRAPVEIGR